jgi:hypothetical protein
VSGCKPGILRDELEGRTAVGRNPPACELRPRRESDPIYFVVNFQVALVADPPEFFATTFQ